MVRSKEEILESLCDEYRVFAEQCAIHCTQNGLEAALRAFSETIDWLDVWEVLHDSLGGGKWCDVAEELFGQFVEDSGKVVRKCVCAAIQSQVSDDEIGLLKGVVGPLAFNRRADEDGFWESIAPPKPWAIKELSRLVEGDQAHEAETTEPESEARSETAEPDLYVFRKVGDTWEVRFEDEQTSGLKDSKGMGYLHHLLDRPNPVNAIPAVLMTRQNPVVRTAAADEAPDYGHGTPGDVLDERAATEYRDRLSEIDQELEQARNGHDEGRVELLEEERESVQKELIAAIGLSGKRRNLGTPEATKVANAVQRNRDRTIRRLEDKGLTQLAHHLSEAIRREGNAFAYRCENPPKWIL